MEWISILGSKKVKDLPFFNYLIHFMLIQLGVSFLDRETQDSLVEEVKKRNDNQVKHIISRIEQAVGFTKFFELIS